MLHLKVTPRLRSSHILQLSAVSPSKTLSYFFLLQGGTPVIHTYFGCDYRAKAMCPGSSILSIINNVAQQFPQFQLHLHRVTFQLNNCKLVTIVIRPAFLQGAELNKAEEGG